MGWLQYGTEIDKQMGICNGAIVDIPRTDFVEYHKQCTSQRASEIRQDQLAGLTNAHTPIRTRYVPFYRIHSKQYFHPAETFYLNWDVTERRFLKADRFAPPEAFGFHFGATLDAAIDEALFYGNGEISEDQFILVADVCLDNILYVMHPVVLKLLWDELGFPSVSVFRMFLSIMNDDRQNRFCNEISLWARSNGYEGIIYPSARYGQKAVAMNKLEDRVPAINFVELGSPLCRGALEPAMWFNQQLVAYLNANDPDAQPLWAEPNLVMFDIEAIGGFDRPIFYFTFGLGRADDVVQMDRRLGSKSYTMWTNDFSQFSVGYKSPYNVQLFGPILGRNRHESDDN